MCSIYSFFWKYISYFIVENKTSAYFLSKSSVTCMQSAFCPFHIIPLPYSLGDTLECFLGLHMKMEERSAAASSVGTLKQQRPWSLYPWLGKEGSMSLSPSVIWGEAISSEYLTE